jgi:hypothetical protein
MTANRHHLSVLLAGVALLSPPVGAADLQLALPIACGPDEPCSIQNYVDLDSGAGLKDFGCGVLTYDSHRGTDFQVRDLARMRAGVPVVAAAPGVVRAARDRMPDTGKAGYEAAGETDRALGNAVAVDHAGGWSTFYGHLRQGSVTVKPGDRVAQGQTLGAVGLSGNTEFPHLHFEVRKYGAVIDPFTGAGPGTACGDVSQALWDAPTHARLPYTPTGVVCAGWSAAAPDRSALIADCDRPDGLSAASPAIVSWIELYGVRKGDTVHATLLGPNGAALAETTAVLEKDRAREFRYLGKKRPTASWPPGTYHARFTVVRMVDGAQQTVIDVAREVVIR